MEVQRRITKLLFHNMKEQPKNYTALWMGVSFVLAVCFFYYATNEPNRMLKAIKLHELDTIATNDSVYVFKIKADTQYYEPEERIPEEPR
jgi:hypothetical protein